MNFIKYPLIITTLFVLFLTSNNNAKANEISLENDIKKVNNTTIYRCINKEVPVFGGYLPNSIWVSYSGYNGYVYKQYYEKTRNNTFLGTYCGTLYYGVAPAKDIGVKK